MSSTSSVGSSSSASNSTAAALSNAFNNLKPQDFINMMIAELKNQDPTSPMDSSQILNELTQIGSMSTTAQLQQVLQSQSVGANLSAASALIGKGIEGLDTNGKQAQGLVSGVVVNNGTPQLIVGNQAVTLSNVQQVIDVSSTTTGQ